MLLFVAKYLSVSREIVFIARGARGFDRPFRNLHVHLHILTKSLFPSTQQHGKPVETNSARGDKKLYGKETR